MKRSTYEGGTVVWQYGTPRNAELGEAGMEQLRLAHRLRNALVEIERRADAAYQAAKREVPKFAEADDAYEAADIEVRRVKKQIALERMQDRSTKPRATSRMALATATAARKAAKALRAEALAAAPEPVCARFAAVWEEAKAEKGKRLYREWVAQGLGWATVGMIRDDMQQAAEKVIARRKQGLPSELRFRRWCGEGTLTVACQQQAGKARRVEWEILGDHPRHKVLRLRIGRARGLEPLWLELPFVMHRPLPCDPQDVTDVQVTRRMVADAPRITIQFTCRVPAIRPRCVGSAIDVAIGWKRTLGGILVAQVSASEPLAAVPCDLRPWIFLSDPCRALVFLATAVANSLENRVPNIKSIRDRALEKLRPSVLAAMDQPEIRAAANGDPGKWKSPARFAALARKIPEEHPLHETLARWRRWDRHLWQYEAHERDQSRARRDDAYRKVADWLVTQAKRVEAMGLPDTDYAEIKRRSETSEDSFEARGGRRQMQVAAPGRLRQSIQQAAHKHGVQINMVGTEKGMVTDAAV